jgi:hypothetical protein
MSWSAESRRWRLLAMIRSLESRVALLEEKNPQRRAVLAPEVARQRLDTLIRMFVAVVTGQDDAPHRQALGALPDPVDIDTRGRMPEPHELLRKVRFELEVRARRNDAEAVELLAHLESAGHA